MTGILCAIRFTARILPVCSLGVLLTAGLAFADVTRYDSGERQVTLIELFTSQGCSSCPPAEAWLGELKQNPLLWKTVIPVAFHVDYWDYLGWKDRFASPAYSARQARYRREGHVASVYTPGFVVNGKEWRGWFRKKSLPQDSDTPGRLTVDLQNNQVTARFQPSGGLRESLNLNLAILTTGINAKIGGGENHGRTLPQDFSVINHQTLSSGNGTWSAGLQVPEAAPGTRLALAAWVSRTGDQKPLQATGGWIPVIK